MFIKPLLTAIALGAAFYGDARGQRAPSTAQRRQMGPTLQALPWAQASRLYRDKHPQYRGVGGYPMDTKGRAIAARRYAIIQLNAGNLTRGDAAVIFHRTARRWDLPTRVIACKRTQRRRHCRAQEPERSSPKADAFYSIWKNR